MKDLRLDKFLTEMGKGSRSQVKTYISKGRVTVNGEIIKRPEYKISPENDIVNLEGEKVNYSQWEYYMLNKPAGCVSATEDKHFPTVVSFIEDTVRKDLFPVGRLDKDTEGLLLISNDGALAHRLLSLRYHVDKKYYVQCANEVTEEMLSKLEQVIELKDEIYQPGRAERISSKEIYLTIQEGKYHQVKRMLHHVGNEVVYLKRVAFGPLKLDARLKAGEWRSLSEDEIKELGGQL